MQSYIKVVLSDDYRADADSWKEMNNPGFVYSEWKSKQYNKYGIFPDFLNNRKISSMQVIPWKCATIFVYINWGYASCIKQ